MGHVIVGRRIKERLDALQLSQAELARRINQRQSTINGLINGEQRTSTKLHNIAQELQTTSEYLSGETDDPAIDAVDLALSYEDREWLDLIHSLEAGDRKTVIKIIRLLSGTGGSATLHSSQVQFQR